MRTWVIPALVAALIGGVLGFGVGRATSSRHSRHLTRQTHHPAAGASAKEAAVKPKPSEIPAATSEAKVEAVPTKIESPDFTTQFFDLILPLFPDDAQELRKWMFPVTLRNADAQAKVFDLLMSTDDPALLEDSAMFLTYAKDPKFVAQLADAFSRETHPARREVLAAALGQNVAFAESVPAVESVLSGKDVSLQTALLKWLSVETISGKPEIFDKVVPSLRNLGLAGESPDVRAAAVRALKGDVTEAGTTFLIDRVLQDSHVEVQKTALSSLPLNLLSIVPPMPAEQLSALWTVFEDSARHPDVRLHAATLILNSANRKVGTLTDEQRQTLKEWADSRRKGAPR